MDDPSITAALATGTNTTSSNPISNWPPYEIYAPYQIDLNQTGKQTNGQKGDSDHVVATWCLSSGALFHEFVA